MSDVMCLEVSLVSHIRLYFSFILDYFPKSQYRRFQLRLHLDILSKIIRKHILITSMDLQYLRDDVFDDDGELGVLLPKISPKS